MPNVKSVGAELRAEPVDQGRLGFLVNKELPELSDKMSCGLGVPHKDADDLLAAERARIAEDRLRPGVVLVRIEDEEGLARIAGASIAPADAPAGEGARDLLYILLAVVADAGVSDVVGAMDVVGVVGVVSDGEPGVLVGSTAGTSAADDGATV